MDATNGSREFQAAVDLLQVAAAWVAFALVHSLTASDRFHAFLRRRAGERLYLGWHRMAYTILSLLTFLALAAYLRALPDVPLYAVRQPFRSLCRFGQLCGLAVLLRTPLSLSAFLGIRQALEYLGGAGPSAPESPPPLCTRKSYGVVRHPLYLGCSAILAFQPDQSFVSLASTCLAIAYFYLGSFHEEKRLVREFGDAYRDYQRTVPRFLPFPTGASKRKGPGS
jgi:protein-S-isoprenylcysteine O-methyltransferase Ste14